MPNSAIARREDIQGYSGQQPGDPVRAAEAIIAAVSSPKPPLHLVLGRVAYEQVSSKLRSFSSELEAWRELSLGADFPETKST